MRIVRQLTHRLCIECGLLAQAIVLLIGVRVGLWLLPFRVVRSLLLCVPPRIRASCISVSVERVTQAVTIASRSMPAATCLVQALAAQALLRRYRHRANLCVGIARGSGGELQAHAWVECGGGVVFGHVADLARFTSVPSLEDSSV
jgi:hypothetical protein